jgi:hypothetical protein
MSVQFVFSYSHNSTGAGSCQKYLRIQAEDKKYIQLYASHLSPTTKRAKWVHDPNEHEDRCNAYKELKFRDEVYQNVNEYAKQKANT